MAGYEYKFNPWAMKGKAIAIKMTNGDIFHGKIKVTFPDWWVFSPVRDGSGDDPAQIIINVESISCIYLIDAELM